MRNSWIKTIALALSLMMAFAVPGIAEIVTGTSNEVSVTPAETVQPKGVSNLSIEITADKTYPEPGDTVKFTITVENAGPDAASNLQIRALSPLTPSNYGDGTLDGDNIAWDVAGIAANASEMCSFDVTIPADAVYNQQYAAFAALLDEEETELGSDSCSVIVKVPGTGLVLDKSVSPAKAKPGDTVTYTLTLDNMTGEGAYQTLTVIDTLPAGMTNASFTDSELSLDNGVLTWTHAGLAAGKMASVSYTSTIPADAKDGDEITNKAEISDLHITDTCTVDVIAPVLTLAKDVDDEDPQPGEWVCFTIGMYNDGGADAEDVKIVDHLPAGMDLDEGELSSDALYDAQARTVTWSVDVAAGDNVERDVCLQVPEDAEDGDKFTNSVSSGALSASCAVTVDAEPDLEIVKKVSDRTPVAGEDIRYTIYVTNNSDFDAEDVRIIDTLPDALAIDTSSITKCGTYSSAKDRITWKIDVPAEETVSVRFWATVPEDAEDGDYYVNKAYIPDVDSSRVTVYVTDGNVPKTGELDEAVYPAPWWKNDASAAADSTTLVRSHEDGEDPALSTLEVAEKPQKNTAFAGEYAQNRDLVGWLVAGNSISEPVFQLDNTYYMTHDWQGNNSVNGSVFMDERNQIWPADTNLILYGHNMRSGAMFGTLDNYRTLSYLQSYPVITFQTVYDAALVNYVPVAVFDASMNKGSLGYVNIRQMNFGSTEEDTSFVEQLKEASLFDIPVDVDAEDKLLTLVTCSYSNDNGRFVIVARRLRDGESLADMAALVVSATQK